MLKTKNSPRKLSDSYVVYTILHIFLGFPLTVLLTAVLMDAIVWMQIGHYQGHIFALALVAIYIFMFWLPIGLLFGILMSFIAWQSGWKRNRAGMAASALANAVIHSILLMLINIFLYAINSGTKSIEKQVIILCVLLLGICASVVGGIFALALPREMPDTVHVSTHKAATKQPEN